MKAKIMFIFLIIGVIFLSGCNQTSPVEKINSDTFIEISLNGGGFYGGINPTTENKIIIKSNGDIIVSYKSLYTNGTETNYFISRNEVEELANFISTKGFFNMQDIYDCSDDNPECEYRKNHYPPAVPIEIYVAIGDLNKTVIVTVHEKGMVKYPDNFDKIINKINTIINNAQE